jgi:hypothetical protein
MRLLTSLLCAAVLYSQERVPGPGGTPAATVGTPTLNQFTGNNVIDRGRNGSGTGVNGTVFNLDPASTPRAVTTGSLVIASGIWPQNPTTGNGYPHACTAPCAPIFTDNGTSNTWTAVFTAGSGCKDAGIGVPNDANHGIYFAANFAPPASGATAITVTHPDKVSDNYWNIANFYNVATASALRTQSCMTAVVPANNTAPNISGTPITVLVGDLVYIEVDDESQVGSINTGGNSWNSVTVPSGCTLLDDSIYAGHAELYCIATGTSFTPQFTISQTTHDSFTIMAAAFKPGAGGSAPTSGASVLLQAKVMTGGNPGTYTQSVACPAATTTLLIADDAAGISSVSDSNGDTFTSVGPGGGAGTPLTFYKVGTTGINPNTFTVSIVDAGLGGVDLITFYCTNATSLDTGATAGAGNTQLTSSSVYTSGTFAGSPSTGGAVSGVPLITPGQTNDLLVGNGDMGTGPYLSISGPTGAVYDFPSPAAINACSVTTAGVCGGDLNDYTNGDTAFHFFDSATSQLSFNAVGNPGKGVGIIVTALH